MPIAIDSLEQRELLLKACASLTEREIERLEDGCEDAVGRDQSLEELHDADTLRERLGLDTGQVAVPRAIADVLVGELAEHVETLITGVVEHAEPVLDTCGAMADALPLLRALAEVVEGPSEVAA